MTGFWGLKRQSLQLALWVPKAGLVASEVRKTVFPLSKIKLQFLISQ
jgi:hypothetical protein